MGAQAKRQFALDTNVLFDLARNEDFAHTFLEVSIEKGYFLFVTPTVVQELDFLRSDPEDGEFACRALRRMLEWKITPYDLFAVGHGITEQFALSLIRKGFLPEAEFNDGQILAETSLAGIPVLITSDSHILSIDPSGLNAAFADKDLHPVAAMAPKNVLRAFGASWK